MAQTVTIRGMSCEGCERNVKEALETVDGVNEIAVDHETDSATFNGSPDLKAIEAAVTAAGYEVDRS